MIKKILGWITGKNQNTDASAVTPPAPYKVETQQVSIAVGGDTTVTHISETPAVAATVQPVWPFPTGQVPEEGVSVTTEEKVQPKKAKKAKAIPSNAVETATVTVSAKYTKTELTKMNKTELLELIAKHGLEVKARASKEELITALSKV
jgi:hypothetical protein